MVILIWIDECIFHFLENRNLLQKLNGFLNYLLYSRINRNREYTTLIQNRIKSKLYALARNTGEYTASLLVGPYLPPIPTNGTILGSLKTTESGGLSKYNFHNSPFL